MASVQGPEDAYFVKLMHEALLNEVRSTLREPLMAEATKMVDAAVDKAVVALQPRLEAWMDQRFNSLKVEVLVNRVNPSEAGEP